MASQEDRRASTRQKILNAAAELFLTNGFEKTTIAQIVAHADIVKGTFYQHFQTKMDLLVVLGRQDGAERVKNLIAQVMQGESALDALQRYYLVLVQWFETYPNIAEDVMLSAIRMHDPSSDVPEHVAHDFTRLMLKIAQERNEVRADIDINSMSIALGGAITLAVIDWCRNPEVQPLQERCKSCFRIFLQGAQSPGKKGAGGKAKGRQGGRA
ncbi:MAG TPA: TetR/AcrR family transcriptional regulator [Gallionella sp.]|nr:TetR/AcrR family transcriptional regulator [Gallionella sp.]